MRSINENISYDERAELLGRLIDVVKDWLKEGSILFDPDKGEKEEVLKRLVNRTLEMRSRQREKEKNDI